MIKSPFYIEPLSADINSYELKKFRVQHDETQLKKYLCKMAKKHHVQVLNKIYLVRETRTKNLVAWFGLKAATLPYNDKDDFFLTPAIELSHFAVDERYKSVAGSSDDKMKTGEFIFWNFILPQAQAAPSRQSGLAENICPAKIVCQFPVSVVKSRLTNQNRIPNRRRQT